MLTTIFAGSLTGAVKHDVQTPEEFMRDYIAEMVQLQKQWASGFGPIRERFFAPGYTPYEPHKNVQTASNERVVSVAKVGDQIEVVTTGHGEQHGMRYTLDMRDDAFRISRLELECSLCGRRGKTRTNCPFCGGKGWKELPLKSRA
jgi:hypothetical protein